jgi:hypothetical protein
MGMGENSTGSGQCEREPCRRISAALDTYFQAINPPADFSAMSEVGGRIENKTNENKVARCRCFSGSAEKRTESSRLLICSDPLPSPPSGPKPLRREP